jgi:hypothetical protein
MIRSRSVLCGAILLAAGCGSRALTAGDAGMDARPVDGQRSEAGTACSGLDALGANGKSLGVGHISDARFSSDGRLLAVLAQGQLHLFTIPALVERPAPLPTLSVSRLAWIDAGRLLVEGNQPAASGLDLFLVDAAADQQRQLAGAVCAYALSPVGDAVYVVSDCSKGGPGKLGRVPLASAGREEVASEVNGASLAVSADGKRVAFVTGQQMCGATLHEAVIGGSQRELDGQAVLFDYLPGGDLLWVHSGCATPPDLLMRGTAAGGSIQLDAGAAFYYDSNPFAISPAGDAVLVAHRPTPASAALELHAVHLDGGGKDLLADDLFPYDQIEMAFRVWTYTAGGGVLYGSVMTYPTMGLGLLTPQGSTWQKQLLSPGLLGGQWELGPSGKEVVLVESDAGGSQLKLVDLQTSLGVVLAISSGQLARARVLPDGRAVLFEEPKGGLTQLKQVGRSGGAPKTLGEWTTGTSTLGSYAIHPGSCAVVIDTDQPTPGGRVVPLRR